MEEDYDALYEEYKQLKEGEYFYINDGLEHYIQYRKEKLWQISKFTEKVADVMENVESAHVNANHLKLCDIIFPFQRECLKNFEHSLHPQGVYKVKEH